MKNVTLGILRSILVLGIIVIGFLVLRLDVRAAESGSCGANATYTYDGEVLTISGTGAIQNGRFQGIRPRKVIIEEGITAIGNNNFDNGNPAIPENCTHVFDNLIEVSIPSTVTSIGDYAFRGCSNLSSVDLSNGVNSLGICAFAYCDNLRIISLPDSITSIGVAAFAPSGITSITIPNGVTSIEANTFMMCHSLSSVTIPNSVTSIGQQAFSDTSFTEITIPESVSSFGVRLFKDAKIYTLTIENISNIVKYSERVRNNNNNTWEVNEHPISYDIQDESSFIVTDALYRCDYLRTINIINASSADSIIGILRTMGLPKDTGCTINAPYQYVSEVQAYFSSATVVANSEPVTPTEESKKSTENSAEVKTDVSQSVPSEPAKSVYQEKIETVINGIRSVSKDNTAAKKTVYLKDITTLPLNLMKELKSNPNVVLDMTYYYMGVGYHVVIPGGATVVTDESIPWYGPLYLYSRYGSNSVTSGSVKATNNANTSVYIVQKGDTLSAISVKLSVPLNKLLAKNPQITNKDKLAIGDKIYY